ncbi:MAG: formyl transferase [Ahrensia sp.]
MDRVAIVTTGSGAPAPIANALMATYPNHHVYLDDPEPKSVFLRRRARKIGWLATAHQFPVMVLGKFAKRWADKRYAQLEATYGVSFTLAKTGHQTAIGSANSQTFIDALAAFQPDIVCLVGARMLNRNTLAQIDCPIVNFHGGINPAYRGLNGGYWSIANHDRANYGTTMHYVDAGVDTGATIAQARFTPNPSDSILTHQHALTAQSVPMVLEAVQSVLSGEKPAVSAVDLPSKQWFHPGLAGYLWRGIRHGHW